jgi:hypothetical protein
MRMRSGPLGSGFRHTVLTVRRPGNVVVRSGEKVAQDAAQVFHDLTSSNSRAISMVITPGLRTSDEIHLLLGKRIYFRPRHEENADRRMDNRARDDCPPSPEGPGRGVRSQSTSRKRLPAISPQSPPG